MKNQNFTHNVWFDAKQNKPYAHSFGSSFTGKCLGHRNVAPLHGPNFLNQCAMEYVVRTHFSRYNAEWIDPVCVANAEMKRQKHIPSAVTYGVLMTSANSVQYIV